jgi:PAS domain-containing protein
MPWRDKDGNIIGTFGISKDVTKMKETEDRFSETSSLLETLLANSPDCIYFKDAESRFVRFSKSFAALFHIANAEDLKGKSDFDSTTNRRSFAPASRLSASWRRKPIPTAMSPGL